MLRPALFVPETKPLNVLLREFRANRNHMAIVIDEYGGVAGLITIEDVLEQIVGDIDDEFDRDERADHIVAEPDGRYRVKALTEIGEFNATFAHICPTPRPTRSAASSPSNWDGFRAAGTRSNWRISASRCCVPTRAARCCSR